MIRPLDLTFFGAFKNTFYREYEFRLHASAHKKIKEYDIAFEKENQTKFLKRI